MSEATARPRWVAFLDRATTAALGTMAVLVIWNNTSSLRPTAEPEAAAIGVPESPIEFGSELKGMATAPAGMIVFSDFQCPYCARFAKGTLPQLEQKYVAQGRLLISYRHFPIDAIHPHAMNAAMAAYCAGRQDRFWAMHDRLFAGGRLDKTSLVGHAAGLNLDADRFDQCLDGEAPGFVDKDLAEAIELRLPASPAFVIGMNAGNGRLRPTRIIVGERSLEVFEAAIASALEAAQTR